MNNDFETLLISSFPKDLKVERDRTVKRGKKLSGVFKMKESKYGENLRAIHSDMIVKDAIMLIIVSNLLILRIESSVNQKYKLMEASRKLMSNKS